MSAELICPTSGLPCTTAGNVDKSLPFDGCPGQIRVVAFHSITPETATGPDGEDRKTYDVGSRVDPFVVCGINALDQTIARNVLEARGNRAASTDLGQVRRAAATLVQTNFKLPEDTLGLHAVALASPEAGGDIVIVDEEAYQRLQIT